MLGLVDVALELRKSGISVLLYDPRSTGLSGSLPRNDIDPVKQTEDYIDAISFLSAQPMVDSERIAVWGMSFSATVALSAASLDRRVKAIIAVCPLVEINHIAVKLPLLLQKYVQDRESQITGNEPIYLPVVNKQGENPAGFCFGIKDEDFMKIAGAETQGLGSLNRTTINSYAKLLMWHPAELWQHLDNVPVLFVVPELDKFCTKDTQLKHLERLPGKKKSFVANDSGHLDILEGKQFPEIMSAMLEFLRQALEPGTTTPE